MFGVVFFIGKKRKNKHSISIVIRPNRIPSIPYCWSIHHEEKAILWHYFLSSSDKKKTLEIPVSKMIFLEQAMPRLFSGVRTMRLISTNTSEIQNTKITKQKPEFIDIIINKQLQMKRSKLGERMQTTWIWVLTFCMGKGANGRLGSGLVRAEEPQAAVMNGTAINLAGCDGSAARCGPTSTDCKREVGGGWRAAS